MVNVKENDHIEKSILFNYISIIMSRYDAWNKALAGIFFSQKNAHRRVYIDLDEHLEHAAKSIEIYENIEQSLCEAVREKLVFEEKAILQN